MLSSATRPPTSTTPPSSGRAWITEPLPWVGIWAWLDEPAGLIRERVFAREAGPAEDEATGSAAMRLGRNSDAKSRSGSRSRSVGR